MPKDEMTLIESEKARVLAMYPDAEAVIGCGWVSIYSGSFYLGGSGWEEDAWAAACKDYVEAVRESR